MPAESKRNSWIQAFLGNEMAGGIFLIIAAILAMILANSPLSESYLAFVHADIGPVLTEKLGSMTLLLWINDGLMAIFFLLVGLEIKREFVGGRLKTWEGRRLPMIAAAAGMAVPAITYLFITRGDPSLSDGWAIPAATDIAFAMGVLALLGSRAPAALKLFLVTVAIVDDMGAVAIIALFYTAALNLPALFIAAAIWLLMLFLGKKQINHLGIYLLLFLCLWYAMLLSGVHATIAGVLAAMTIPLGAGTSKTKSHSHSPLLRLEHALYPLVAFLIVPLFGFANAGVVLGGLTIEQILAPLPMGIALGLLIGKPLGIFSSIWLAVKMGLARPLRGATWLQIYGISMLCGIGFTMSLFISGLAFSDNALLQDEAKVGVLMGSVVSAILGYIFLRFAPLHADHAEMEAESATEAKNAA